MYRNVFWRAVLGCLVALALPGSALAAAPPSITGSAAVAEGVAGGKASFTVNCGSAAPVGGIGPEVPYTGTLTVAVAGGPAPAATKDADFGEVSTTTIPCTVATPSGTVDVPIVNDSLDEPNEKFTVTITGTLLAPLGDPASVDVNTGFTTAITDDDVPEATISPLATVLEGENPSAALTVTLSQVPVEPATISYATDAFSALAGSDFTAASGELTIPAGQQTGTISIPIVDDTAPEKPEGFYVNLTSAVNATLNATKKQGIVAIFDKDTAPPPSFSLPKGAVVKEGNSGTVNVLFTVSLAEAAAEQVSVDWKTVNFTANTADYESAAGKVTFAPGETTKTVSVNVKGDQRDEPNEAFGVVLGNPVGGVIGAGKAFGIITDDDGPKVSIGKPVFAGKRALVSVLICPETADLCKGRLVATVGKVKYGAANFELAKGKGDELKLKLSRKARRALRKKARRVTFTATAADGSGAQRVAVRKFRVKRIRR